jgi:site-specific DNA-methyltransferase (adenine-specific)
MELGDYLNTVTTGDCTRILGDFPSGSVDLVLTDPPYITSYRPRDGRTVTNDSQSDWLKPAFRELYRVLKPDSFCVTFYGWPMADLFVSSFRESGFRPVSHLCFVKQYASFTGYTRAQHEVAYVLAKGRPNKPEAPIADVLTWRYTGNKLHPTEKPVSVLIPLVEAFSNPGDVVLDPFCGSGSSLVAAKRLGRHFTGIEIDAAHAELARNRIAHLNEAAA